MEKNDYPTPHCIYCGHNMVWESTVPKEEVSADTPEGDHASVDYYLCPYCGRDYEICEPNEEERYLYPYWDVEDEAKE